MGKIGLGDGFELVVCPLLLAADPEPVSYPGDLLGLAVLPPLPVPDPVYKRGLIDLNSTHVLYLHF